MSRKRQVLTLAVDLECTTALDQKEESQAYYLTYAGISFNKTKIPSNDVNFNGGFLLKTCLGLKISKGNSENLLIDFFEHLRKYFKRPNRHYAKASVVLWLANSSRYDGEFIKSLLLANGFEYESLYLPYSKKKKAFNVLNCTSGDILISVKYHNLILYFKDFQNIQKISVADMGKHLKIDKDQPEFKPLVEMNEEDWDKMIAYGLRDVKILASYVNYFQSENHYQIPINVLTSSGLTFKKLRSHLNAERKEASKYLMIDYQDYCRDHYFGGFTAANHQNVSLPYHGDIYYYDVNSLYPYIMTFKMPTVRKEPRTIHWKEAIKENPILMRVNIKKAINKPNKLRNLKKLHSSMRLPEYLERLETETTYHLWSDEFLAIKENYDLDYEVIDFIEFEYEAFLKSYIEKLYLLRLKNKQENRGITKKVIDAFLKIQLVSVYGKFGQNPIKESIYYSQEKLKHGAEVFLDVFDFQEKIIKQEKFFVSTVPITPYYSGYYQYKLLPSYYPEKAYNIYVASYITMKARCHMYSLINQLPFQAWRYTDTDSIITTTPLPAVLVDPHQLGKLKLEYSELNYRYFRCFGPKKYILSNESVINNQAKITMAGFNKFDNLIQQDLRTLKLSAEIFIKKTSSRVKGGKLIYDKEQKVHKIQEAC